MCSECLENMEAYVLMLINATILSIYYDKNFEIIRRVGYHIEITNFVLNF